MNAHAALNMQRMSRVAPWLALGLTYLALLVPEVMEVDAAQYASMAREMLERGQWLSVEHRLNPYLDKPPLLFWASAGSMALFGPTTWAYKLPTLLAFVVALVATYRYAALWYDARVGRAAALLLGSCIGALLLLQDVRTDGLLLSAVIIALWQWSVYLHTGRMWPLAAGWAAAAVGMLAKGPIGLMVPLLGIGCHLLLAGRWRELLRPQVWLIGILTLAALLSPMLLGLWRQYGIEGWRFFFYTQSFGRLTGDNTWNNDGGLSFFFVHTYAWSIAPWTLLFGLGLFRQVRQSVAALRGGGSVEWVTLAGFVLSFLALSFSRYKLPHYIYVLLPLGAVMAGRALIAVLDAGPTRLRAALVSSHLVLCGLLWALVFVLGLWAFPVGHLGVGMLLALALGSTLWLAWARGAEGRLVWAPVATVVGVGLFMGLHLYPTWLSYQSANAAAHAYMAQPTGRAPLVQLHTRDHALEFYTRRIVPRMDDGEARGDSVFALPQVWVYTDAAGRDSLSRLGGVRLARSISLAHYPVQLLTGAFIDPSTRAKVLRTRYLLLLERAARLPDATPDS